jgi:TonB family protein
MIGFNRREKKVFRYSLFFHLFGACFLFALGLFPSCEEEPEEIHVFELAMASEQPIAPQPVPTPPPTPTLPVKVTPKPEPKPLPPTPPKVDPVVKPKPVPQPKPTLVKPKPVPKPTPKPTPKPKAISFKDFQKKNNLKPTKPKPQVTRPSVPVVKIDASRFKPLDSIKISSNTGNAVSSVPASVLNAYLSAVKMKLERVWESKLRSTSITNGGEAWLSFEISPNGTLFRKKISKSSGNSQLDRLVLQVANLVGNVGAPPGGKLESALKIPFRLN